LRRNAYSHYMTGIVNQNDQEKNVNRQNELVGLIPAAGIAARITPLPCSKELFPIGYRVESEPGELRPKPVCLYLLEHMHSAGVRKVFIVLRSGKWDIPAYLGNGAALGMNLAYLLMQQPFGAPFTIDEAYPFTNNKDIAFGFPDILFNGEGVIRSLHHKLVKTQADVVLGLFPIRAGQRADMVETGQDGCVQKIWIKPVNSLLTEAWITAVWRPTFSGFMHSFLQSQLTQGKIGKEFYVGDVLQAAINEGLTIQSVSFSEPFFDIGTPNGLLEAIRIYGHLST
jgi:glucose-1-phosphate thymidylyltransferase